MLLDRPYLTKDFQIISLPFLSYPDIWNSFYGKYTTLYNSYLTLCIKSQIFILVLFKSLSDCTRFVVCCVFFIMLCRHASYVFIYRNVQSLGANCRLSCGFLGLWISAKKILPRDLFDGGFKRVLATPLLARLFLHSLLITLSQHEITCSKLAIKH